jgi:OHCU decarboxylase
MAHHIAAESRGTDVKTGQFNDLSRDAAVKILRECNGSSRWVSAMIERRPFGSRDAVFNAADEIWKSLDPSDWLEAFAHHPRIGEQTKNSVAAREQSGVKTADDDVRAQLAQVNRDYEQRFGYIYIVCATGKGGEEMLAAARNRLNNDPATELRVAAEEQRKITQLRLARLLED